jgi:hypothetical protein
MSDGKSGMEAFETMMAAVVEGRTCVCVFAVAGATCKPGDVLSGAIILGLATAGDFAVLMAAMIDRATDAPRALADAIGGVPGERLLGHVCELIESSAPARGRITGSVIRQGGRRDDVPETERD